MLDERDERVRHLLRHRVELLGAGEGDRGDGTVDLEQDVLVRRRDHRRLLSGTAARRSKRSLTWSTAPGRPSRMASRSTAEAAAWKAMKPAHSRPHPRLLDRGDGAAVEAAGGGVDGFVGPGRTQARLTGVGGDPRALVLRVEEAGEMSEQRVIRNAPRRDGDAGAADRRPSSRPELHARRVVEAQRVGARGVGDVAVDERDVGDVAVAAHPLEQPDRVQLGGSRRERTGDHREQAERPFADGGVDEPAPGTTDGSLPSATHTEAKLRNACGPARLRATGATRREVDDLRPCARGGRNELGDAHGDLRGRIERERPEATVDRVRGRARPHRGARYLSEEVGWEQRVERLHGPGGDRVAEVRVVEHDHVVAFGEGSSIGRGLEPLERLRVPLDETLRRRHPSPLPPRARARAVRADGPR